ncbi:MAG: hypothetical protein NXI31_11705 [bacterium]|nr:hypothetical protein [bacterium]
MLRYGPEPGALAATIQRILNEREHFGAAARRGANIVRRAFDMPRVAAQYLRYLTFRSAAPRNQRQPVDTASLPQKRLCVYKAWLPDSAVARRRSMQASFAFLGEVVQREPSATVVNDMARELICEFTYYERHEQVESDEQTLLADALALLERGMDTWPDRLVLRFNFVRTALHHGTPEQRVQALQLAFDTLDLEMDWRVDAMDDVLPFDFHPEFFNYRDYLALVAARCAGDATVTDRSLAELMLAALAGYLGRKTRKVSLHERAAELDPGFARYRMDLAASLVAEGDAAATARAIPILERLAAGSTEFPAAAELLESLRGRGEHAIGGGLALRRLQEDTIDTAVETRELILVERRAQQAAKEVRMALPGARESRLAVLIPLTGDGLELSALLAGLQNQTIVSELQVLVVAERTDRAIANTLAAYEDSALAIRTVEVSADAGYAERLNACAQAATAPLLTVTMPGDLVRVDAFEQLVVELEEAPEADIVNASEGWITEPVNEFRPEIIAAVSCRPGFSQKRQFEVDCVGLHAVWRRTLHDRFGWFDPEFGVAAEYEMWLRVIGDGVCGVRQRRAVLVASPLSASWRRARDVAAAPADMERARQAHRDSLDVALPPIRMHRILPAVLFTPSLREEAEVHARLGILSNSASRNVRLCEDFFATALMHGDTETALLTVATCAERHPSLLSARLTWARLLEALGRTGADEVLRAGLADEPYAALLRAELARRGVADPALDAQNATGIAALADFVLPCPR